jgi:hypothetical protein
MLVVSSPVVELLPTLGLAALHVLPVLLLVLMYMALKFYVFLEGPATALTGALEPLGFSLSSPPFQHFLLLLQINLMVLVFQFPPGFKLGGHSGV